MTALEKIEEHVYDPPLDPGIKQAVIALNEAGIETFESCQGGDGHSFPEPTIRFHGDASEGLRATAAAIQVGLPVVALRRVWNMIDGELTGPDWELTFDKMDGLKGSAGGKARAKKLTPLAYQQALDKWTENIIDVYLSKAGNKQ